MLTAEQLAVIQQTVPVLQEHGETLTRHFYQRLFRENPEVKAYFNPAHQRSGSQQRALAGAICAYAQHVDNPAALMGAVELIAQKHASLGIRPEHYPIVGANLLASIREVLGEAASDDIINAWAAAYGALADIFIQREAEIYQAQEQAHGWQGFKRFVVTRREPVSTNILSLYLEPEDGRALRPHRPGQYVTIRVTPPGGRTEMRNYSLSNRPGEAFYRISVKREEGTPAGVCSNYLHDQLKVGQQVELSPPCGEFVLQENQAEKPLVLIAGGVGITPILSMLHASLASSPRRPVVFIQGALNSAVQPFQQELAELKRRHANLTAHLRYSEPLPGDRAGVSHDSDGLIDAGLLDHLVGDCVAEYYFCGPEPMLQAVHGLLRERGVDEADIHYEFFGPAGSLAA
ncbi:NO-inducible flavohemoprotein [Alloalcanivorax mobilis]|uniref:NO-inducible flavohemoprotein n=1 Tax=Alloalcanivorax mobilis TaxID=2019569 RepID=UPI000C763AD4|nr:NO-inducible flavohemoprotein [Alloalcanivorax mobilis]